ncbi:DUF6653 family protein [uncultured Roseibium sp.]|uniref:DUF6653 family protein n=1 Tax=uncultured Roseibium sp. TaxID=1936171 RepID=UPI00261D1E2C|nr:DUF6653 family protein [uncultured Roseibium sp.]
MQTTQRPSLSIANEHMTRTPVQPTLQLRAHGAMARPASAMVTYIKIVAPCALTAALWTHVWLGSFGSILIAVAVMAGFLALSRLFIAAGKRSGWARRVSFGERVWLNRMVVPIPQNLNFRITTLYLVFWTGTLVAMTGGFTASLLLALSGLTVAYATQFVCFRKLIHLHSIMQDKTALYRFWSIEAVNDNSRSGLQSA